MYEIALAVAIILCIVVAFDIREMHCQTQFDLAKMKREIDTIRKLAMIQRFSQFGYLGKETKKMCLTCGVIYQSRNRMFQHLKLFSDHKV